MQTEALYPVPLQCHFSHSVEIAFTIEFNYIIDDKS